MKSSVDVTSFLLMWSVFSKQEDKDADELDLLPVPVLGHCVAFFIKHKKNFTLVCVFF
jgi:hypothetical protein